MRMIIRIGALASAFLLATHNALGQGINQSAPVLNGIGRFLGVGYSQGYHANYHPGQGRGLMRDHHVKPYIDPSLTAIYSPGYNAHIHRSGHGWMSPTTGQPTATGGDGYQSILQPNPAQLQKPPVPTTQPKASSNLADPVPSPSDKPATPPPAWLEKYLPPKNPPTDLTPENKAPAPSVEELPPATPKPQVAPAPKDEPLPAPPKPSTTPKPSAGDDDDLLGPTTDADEDLLLPSDSASSLPMNQLNRYTTAARLSRAPYRAPHSQGPVQSRPVLQLAPRY